MITERHLGANTCDFAEIDFRECKAEPRLGAFGNDLAPRVDDQRMAKGLSPFRVSALLSSSGDPTLVFYRPRAQQNMPMGYSGRASERRRHRDKLRAVLGHPAKKLWESQIVANAESGRHAA